MAKSGEYTTIRQTPLIGVTASPNPFTAETVAVRSAARHRTLLFGLFASTVLPLVMIPVVFYGVMRKRVVWIRAATG
mgnify:CR=1 FL=1